MLPTFIRLYEVFYKKYFLDFFQNYQEKPFNGDLLQWRYYPVSCNILLKKRFLRRYIPVNFETFSRTTLLENSGELLLLYDEEIQNAYWVHCIARNSECLLGTLHWTCSNTIIKGHLHIACSQGLFKILKRFCMWSFLFKSC